MTNVMTPLTTTQIARTFKTDYCGNVIYENGELSRILTEEGYITLSGTTPTYHYYLKDHQGNNRVVINQSGTVEQVNHYYPFGGLFGESTSGGLQPYKYNGKELDRMHGLNLFDYGARHYDAALGRWHTVDPLAEKYYGVSPYAYVGNNPVNAIDLKGDSITVLNQGGAIGHSALLIQNENGKWQYFSMNGDWIYDRTNGAVGGKPYHDKGEKIFNSPQEFLASSYNTAGNREKVVNNEVNNYEFKEGYILPTTPEQDKTISKKFTEITNNETYSLGIKSPSNQCANVVQRSLNAAGIKTSLPITETITDRKHGEIFYINFLSQISLQVQYFIFAL